MILIVKLLFFKGSNRREKMIAYTEGPEKILVKRIDSFVLDSNFCETPCNFQRYFGKYSTNEKRALILWILTNADTIRARKKRRDVRFLESISREKPFVVQKQLSAASFATT